MNIFLDVCEPLKRQRYRAPSHFVSRLRSVSLTMRNRFESLFIYSFFISKYVSFKHMQISVQLLYPSEQIGICQLEECYARVYCWIVWTLSFSFILFCLIRADFLWLSLLHRCDLWTKSGIIPPHSMYCVRLFRFVRRQPSWHVLVNQCIKTMDAFFSICNHN